MKYIHTTAKQSNSSLPTRLPQTLVPILVAIGLVPLPLGAQAQRHGGMTELQGGVTTTIDFEDLAAGTEVTDQYQPLVEFLFRLNSVPEGGIIPRIESVDATMARSGVHVLNITGQIAEFQIAMAGGVLSTPARSISAYVGFFPFPFSPGDTATVILQGVNTAHVVVAEARATVSEGAGFHTLLEVSSPAEDMAFFRFNVESEDIGNPIGLDDLSITTPLVARPDFSISLPSGVQLLQGGSTPVSVGISRFGGSVGPIQLSLSGLPAGVSGVITPNPATSGATVLLAAELDAPLVSPGQLITLTGEPTVPEAGDTPRSTTTLLSVRRAFEIILPDTSPELLVPECNSRTLTVIVRRNLDFAGSVALSAAGLPAGVDVQFDPPVVDFAGGVAQDTSTMTLTAGPNSATPAVEVEVMGSSTSSAATARDTLRLLVYQAPTRIRVTNNLGAGVPFAEIYIDGVLTDFTDAMGVAEIDPPLDSGAQIVARMRVLQNPTYREDHGLEPWNCRVYATSLPIRDDGSAQPHVVLDPCAVQELRVSGENTLVGVNIVASMNWDVSRAEMEDIQSRLLEASDYLYNATDGQVIFEEVSISDIGIWADGADYRINVAREFTSINDHGGIRPHVDYPLGSFFEESFGDRSWMHMSRESASRTYVHEFGHYGFALRDEYADDDPALKCTAMIGFPFAGGDPSSSCVMWYQGLTEKFCSGHPSNPHVSGTRQGAASCWSGIVSRFNAIGAPMKKPDSNDGDGRSVIVGTVNGGRVPVEGWRPRFRVNNRSFPDLCAPYLLSIVFNYGGAECDVFSSTPWGAWLWHGSTRDSIFLHGLHIGDSVHVREKAFFPRESDFSISSCLLTPQTRVESGGTGFELTLQPSPFQIQLALEPEGDRGARLRVGTARGTRRVDLAGEPTILVTDPSLGSRTVPSTYDNATRSWTAALGDLPNDWNATVRVEATNLEGETATIVELVTLARIHPASETEVFHSDGSVSIEFPSATVPAGSRVALGPCSVAWPTLGAGQVVVGRPVSVRASEPLLGTARLRFRLPNTEGGPTGFEQDSFLVLRATGDGRAWVELGETMPANAAGVVGVEVQELGCFALVARLAPPASGPDCTAAVASVPVLWPPNHKLVPVAIHGLTGSDPANAPTLEITRVTCNEPSNDGIPGDRSPDAVISGTTVHLRAERDPGGQGRTYRIEFRATDATGESSGLVTVCVPHNQGMACLDDGRAFDPTE